MQIKIKSENNKKLFEEIDVHDYFIEEYELNNDKVLTVYQKTSESEYRNVFYDTGVSKNHKHSFPDRVVYQIVFGDVEIKILN